MSRALVQAVVPTTRAVAWTPVLASAAGLLALASVLRASDATSPVAVSVGAGATAAALVFALRDPAAALLAAVPVSRAARRTLRLGLATAVALPLWLLDTSVLPGDGAALAPLAALVATGLAVATWLPADRDVTVAAAVPLTWVTLGELLGDLPDPIGTVVLAWSAHPWPVATAGAALFVLGRHR